MMNVSTENSDLGASDAQFAESTKQLVHKRFLDEIDPAFSTSPPLNAPYSSPPRVPFDESDLGSSHDPLVPKLDFKRAVTEGQLHEPKGKIGKPSAMGFPDEDNIQPPPEIVQRSNLVEPQDSIRLPNEQLVQPEEDVSSPAAAVPRSPATNADEGSARAANPLHILAGSSNHSPYDQSDFVFFAESDRPITPGEFMGGIDDGFDYAFATSIKSGVVTDEGMTPSHTLVEEEYVPVTAVDGPSHSGGLNPELTGDWATSAIYGEFTDDSQAYGDGPSPQEVDDMEQTYVDLTSGYLLPYPEWVERRYKSEVQMTQYGYITPPPPVRTPPFRRQNSNRSDPDKKRRKNRNEEKKRLRQRTNVQNSAPLLGLDLQQSLAALSQLTSALQQFGLNGLTLSSLLSAAQASTPGGTGAASMGGPANLNAQSNNIIGQLANLGYLGQLYNPLMVPAATAANPTIGALTQALQQQYLIALQSQLLNQQLLQQNGQVPTPGQTTDPMRIPMEYLGLDYLANTGTPTPGTPMTGIPQMMAPNIPSPHDVAEMMSQSMMMGRSDGMSPPLMHNHGFGSMARDVNRQTGGPPVQGRGHRLAPEFDERKQRVPRPPSLSNDDDGDDSIGVLGTDTSLSENVDPDADLDWNRLIGETFPSFSDARIELRPNPHRGVVYGPLGSEDENEVAPSPHNVEPYGDEFGFLPSVPQVDGNSVEVQSMFGLPPGMIRSSGDDMMKSAYDGNNGGAAEFEVGWFENNWGSRQGGHRKNGGGSSNSGSGEELRGNDGSGGNEMDVMSGGAQAPNRNAQPPSHSMSAAIGSSSPPNAGMKKRPIAGKKRNSADRQRQLFDRSLEIKSRVASLAQDNSGCRYLQQLLDQGNAAVFYMIYTETLPVLCQLMTDRFGNYLCQKMIDYCAQEQRLDILRSISAELVSISQNVHGTRVVQKLVACVESEKECGLIAASLSGSVATLTKDLNGNHVVQLCLRYMHSPEECNDERCSNQFVFDELSANLRTVATHKHGCCVLQRCLLRGSESQINQIARAIVDHAYELSQDAFGNYVVQKYMSSNIRMSNTGEAVIDAVYDRLRGRLTQLSAQKFSSNVVEHCLVSSSAETRRMVIDELMQESSIRKLIQDRYGNYVIQRVLEVADADTELPQLVETVRPYVQALGETEIGQRIQKTFVYRFPQLLDHGPHSSSFLNMNMMSHGGSVSGGGAYEHYVDHSQHGGVSSPPHMIGLGHDSITQRNYEMSNMFGMGQGMGMDMNVNMRGNSESSHSYMGMARGGSGTGHSSGPSGYGDVSTEYSGYGGYSSSGYGVSQTNVYNQGYAPAHQLGAGAAAGGRMRHQSHQSHYNQAPPDQYGQYGGYSHGMDYFH